MSDLRKVWGTALNICKRIILSNETHKSTLASEFWTMVCALNKLTNL